MTIETVSAEKLQQTPALRQKIAEIGPSSSDVYANFFLDVVGSHKASHMRPDSGPSVPLKAIPRFWIREMQSN